MQRLDPGPCRKVHSDVLKNAYEVAHETEHPYNFNEEVIKYLQDFIAAIDRKVEANQGSIMEQQKPQVQAKVFRKYVLFCNSYYSEKLDQVLCSR